MAGAAEGVLVVGTDVAVGDGVTGARVGGTVPGPLVGGAVGGGALGAAVVAGVAPAFGGMVAAPPDEHAEMRPTRSSAARRWAGAVMRAVCETPDDDDVTGPRHAQRDRQGGRCQAVAEAGAATPGCTSRTATADTAMETATAATSAT